MLGMSDMLADMLKKSIPPEVMELLTAEKLKELGDKANAFITDIRQSLEFIKAQNVQTHELLQSLLEHTSDNHSAILSTLEEGKSNDGNGSGKPQRRRASGGNGNASGGSADE